MSKPLFHYTCGHSAPGIRADGLVRPGHELGAGPLVPWSAFVWLTDMAVPIRDALGLTSYCLDCDRTAFRFQVWGAPEPIRPWLAVRRNYEWAEYLESAPGARPAHWHVSPVAVPVVEAPDTGCGPWDKP